MKKRYEGLSALRGLGCIMIVAYHVYVLRGFLGTNPVSDHTVGVGGSFVPMFFMLSAFSCMCGYYDKMVSGTWSAVEEFYLKRIKRLIPTFYLAIILHLIINFCISSTVNIPSLIGTSSFLFGLMPQYRESMVDAGWALGIEVIFYLGFPAFVIACKSKRRTWLTLAGTLLLLWSYFSYYAAGADPDANNENYNIIRQLIFFVTGALLYHYKDHFTQQTVKKRWLTTLVCLIFLVFTYWRYFNTGGVINLVYVAVFFLRNDYHTDIRACPHSKQRRLQVFGIDQLSDIHLSYDIRESFFLYRSFGFHSLSSDRSQIDRLRSPIPDHFCCLDIFFIHLEKS